MPQGLQIFDKSGQIVLDTNTQTTTFLGKITINQAGEYRVQDERFAWGKPFYLVGSFAAGAETRAILDQSDNAYRFIVSHSALVGAVSIVIYYGVY